MSVCSFLARYMLYLFNLLCLISGVGILSIAFIVRHKFYKWSDFLSTQSINLPQIMVAIGIVLLLISIIGLCSVLRDSKCLMNMFSIFLTIVLVGELILSAVIYTERGTLEEYALKQMNHSMTVYNQSGHESTTQAWNLVQTDMECCGLTGPDDWHSIISNNEELPKSCCHAFPSDKFCTKADSYQTGCFSAFTDTFRGNNNLIMWSVIVFAFVQLFAVLLACCRRCSIQEEYETV